MRRGHTPQRGTAQLEFPSGQAANVHLPSFEFSPAKNADPLVIERIPAPERVAYAQDREPIIEIKMSDHMQWSSLLIASMRTIGAQADWLLGENPTTRVLYILIIGERPYSNTAKNGNIKSRNRPG